MHLLGVSLSYQVVIALLADYPGRSSIKATESWQPLIASVSADQAVKGILPHNSDTSEKNAEGSGQAFENLSLHGEHQLDSSYNHDIDSRLAAEKHAYLHSQHGMEDTVF